MDLNNQQQQQQPIDYVNLLSGLSDSDGEIRRQAEEVYNTIPAKDRFTMLGVALCKKELPEPVRIFAAVLLRRLILSFWQDIQSSVPPQQLLPSCNELLNVLRNATNESKEIRDKMCQVVAALGKSYLNETSQTNEWSEFIQFLFELFRSPQPELREAGYTIFASNPEVLGQVDDQTAYIEQVHQCLMEGFRTKR